MSLKTEITLNASKVLNPKYDAVAKENFKKPELLAPILKNVVPEFNGYTSEEIVGFIVKESINDDPVDDVSVIANQLPEEMSSISEKLIRYDSRFKIINPRLSDKTINIYLHIDFEVQGDYRPSNPNYPIIKRAIYYGAKEISSQLGILTNKTDYNNLEKVYSIWICNENIPKELQNTVTSYKITKTDEIGITDEPEMDYDLMTICLIRRGNKESDAEVFDYLTSLFNSDIDGICRYIDIRDNEDVVKGVEQMTGLGDSIYNKGLQQGVQQGIKSTIINMITNKVPDDKIILYTGCDIKMIEELRNRVQ